MARLMKVRERRLPRTQWELMEERNQVSLEPIANKFRVCHSRAENRNKAAVNSSLKALPTKPASISVWG